jgi:two-component system, OmpR family, response regulator
MRALARRGRTERPTVLEAGSLRLDPATHQVWRVDTAIGLSAIETVRGVGYRLHEDGGG